MITKEELIDIIKEGWQPTGYYSVNFNANRVADKILERINKDSEVPEMLISHLVNAGIISVDSEIFHLTLTLNGEEYNKLEEWLNDKYRNNK